MTSKAGREASGGNLNVPVTTMSTVVPETVSWLWPGRLPLGKLAVIDGDPSTGKSTLTLDLAARVSTGKAWPDGQPNSAGPAGVLLLSAEDGLADTIRPRLDAADADVARVHALSEVTITVPDDNGNDVERRVPPSLPRDIGVIEKVIREHGIKLVVVDVLMAYLNGKVDSHRDQDVRGVLHQLAATAERTDCTVTLIRHLNKAGGGNALYRGGGSIGIIGAARAAFLVARDPDDEDRRVFAVTKSNLAAEPPSLAYRLVDSPEHGCARVEWEPGTVEHTAASLLRVPVDEDERTERDEAADWLVDVLGNAGGREFAKDVKAAARKAGIAVRTLERARSKVATVETSGFPRTSTWVLKPDYEMDTGGSSDSDATDPGHISGGATEPRGATGADQHKHNDQSRQQSQSRQSRHPSVSGTTDDNVIPFQPGEPA